MDDALKMFNINDINTINLKELKKLYMKKAILLHPDKGGSNEEFIKLQENYDELKHVLQENEVCDFDKLCNTFITFMTCENEVRKNELHNELIYLFNNISNEWYNKLDEQYKIILKMLYEKYNKITSQSKKLYNLFVSFEDIYNDAIYKLYYENNLFLVPLWSKECFFDYNNMELHVRIFVDLPDNVSIDEYNNIHIYRSFDLLEVFDKDNLEIKLFNISFNIKIDNISLRKNQILELNNEGISPPEQSMEDSAIKKTIVFIHLELYT